MKKPLYSISATELLTRVYEDLSFLVPNLIPAVGVIILAAPPKTGKSFLVLFIAFMLSLAYPIFGYTTPEPVQGLYIAMEDNEARLHRRLKKFGIEGNDNLVFVVKIEPGETGIDQIDAYLEDHPQVKLIILDTLGYFFAQSAQSTSGFLDDYQKVRLFKDLAERRKIAIILVHHTRKMPDINDEFNEVSGTTGITAAADAILLLRRARGRNEAILSCTGRDFEDNRILLQPDFKTGNWTVVEGDEISYLTGERREILRVLKNSETPMTPLQLSKVVFKSSKSISLLLSKLYEEGLVDKGEKYGTWFALKPNKPKEDIKLYKFESLQDPA